MTSNDSLLIKILLPSLVLLNACHPSVEPTPIIPQRVGGDRDAHDCIGSAGYRWCAKENACMRPWELATEKQFENSPSGFDSYCSASPTSIPDALNAASANDVANRFYHTYLTLQPSGLPSEEAMKTLAPLLTNELTGLIAAARRAQQDYKRKYPTDKPPFIDGNLFASNWEGVSAFTLGAATLNDGKASIPVYLQYRDTDNVVSWIDVIVLEQVNTEWRVWDIFMNAPWAFRSGPSLRAILATP